MSVIRAYCQAISQNWPFKELYSLQSSVSKIKKEACTFFEALQPSGLQTESFHLLDHLTQEYVSLDACIHCVHHDWSKHTVTL